jgi:hypothetical protein
MIIYVYIINYTYNKRFALYVVYFVGLSFYNVYINISSYLIVSTCSFHYKNQPDIVGDLAESQDVCHRGDQGSIPYHFVSVL